MVSTRSGFLFSVRQRAASSVTRTLHHFARGFHLSTMLYVLDVLIRALSRAGAIRGNLKDPATSFGTTISDSNYNNWNGVGGAGISGLERNIAATGKGVEQP